MLLQVTGNNMIHLLQHKDFDFKKETKLEIQMFLHKRTCTSVTFDTQNIFSQLTPSEYSALS